MMAARVQMKIGTQSQAMIARPVSRGIAAPRPRVGRSFPQPRAAKDFDEVLMDVANKFEKADNKVPIVGWALAAFSAITVAEWFMHLPLFDFLLGFPIQFLGLLTAGSYGLKLYKGEKIDYVGELEDYVNKVSKELPGIGK